MEKCIHWGFVSRRRIRPQSSDNVTPDFHWAKKFVLSFMVCYYVVLNISLLMFKGYSDCICCMKVNGIMRYQTIANEKSNVMEGQKFGFPLPRSPEVLARPHSKEECADEKFTKGNIHWRDGRFVKMVKNGTCNCNLLSLARV
jgi:hypothetical protein